MPRTVNAFLQETIEGLSGPCSSYHGMVAAIETPQGQQVIVMAGDLQSLIKACREISPSIILNTSMCAPASIVHDQYVVRKDNEI